MPYTTGPPIDLSWIPTQPTIDVDDELTLRPFHLDDATTITRAFDDPDIQHWHAFRVDEPDEAVAWIEATHAKWQTRQSITWAITDRTDMLGRCALHLHLEHRFAEVAYWLLPEARGRGVATRVAIAATEWAHEVGGFHRVLLQHSTQNLSLIHI